VIVSIKSWLQPSEQPREALHKASSGRDGEQDSVLHLFARRELGEALRDGVCGDRHGDGARAINRDPLADESRLTYERYARAWSLNR
jgi:hypothetical protein